ncbi:hypothetical protein [Streptomyces sp. NBC_00385]|uniref:hypothetical protein n=1 Tax=Streptomyces sp. NBC_00385 TaxID=2975733 RepID=UPI002DD91436|nr:hypothetical protein [Streptomyces sp. NBC_00385]WRZ01847.1 hypothetical protein OG959_00140 [Streptomyces sp. NBC_00385]
MIDPDGFQAALTTRQDTALGTPLGHLVSPDAPAGLVHGVALAAPGSPAPAVQRTVEMPLRLRSKPAPVAVQRVYGESVPALTTAAGSSAEAGLPVRHLVGDEPLVQRSEAAGQSDAVLDTSEASPGAAALRRTDSSPSAQPPRRTPGLGAPLPGLPPTAQRQAHRPSDVQPALPRPPVARREPTSAASADESSASAGDATPVAPEMHVPSDGTEAAAAVAPLLGDAPLAGADSGGEPGGEDVAVATPTPTGPVQRSAAVPAGIPPVPPPAAGPTAPLLGDRPLSLRSATDPGPPAGAVVQRAPEGGGAQRMPAPPAGPPPSEPSAVPVRWTAPDPGAPSGPPAALLRRAAAPVQRQAAGAPAVQRRTGGAPPVPASAAVRTGGRAAASPTAGSVAVAAGVAQRMADGSVVFGAAPLHGTSRPVVQRDAEIAEEPPPLPEPEPPPAAEPEPGPEASAGPGVMPAVADSDARAGAVAGQGAPPVTDELVRALYGPLSRLLKADLRLDRERAGFHINTRH